MMNIDLGMKQDAKKKSAKEQFLDEEEAAFHFVAYVPIEGDVWKLDGLERQPKCLGMCSRSLLEQTRSATGK
jgi:ubiquitin carboxyl-terminal hydrolase L5